MAGNFVKVGRWGECLWGIDENGNLLIDGGVAESITEDSPWYEYRDLITSATATREISFPDGASISGLFKGCRKMLKADLSGFDTSNVSDMSSVFEGCANLAELDISSFDTTGCSNMDRMFAQCAKLDDILLGDDFSPEGDGSTSCGRLAVKEYGKYRKGKPISVEGFTVRYHSNFDNGKDNVTEERVTVPNTVYTAEEDIFGDPEGSTAFMCWNTEADGSGYSYGALKPIGEVDTDLDLYAVWGHLPEVGPVKEPDPVTFGETIPFELPEITSVNDPEVTGYLEISETGEEDSWRAIRHDAVLPVAYDGYLLRLHVANSIGEAVSNAVRIHINKATIDTSGVRWAEEEN
ncbi:MAG: BspA family leucine-rich repeat surface protein, partial [Mogibacterium sp.]|nr:BspA family leucine-rich repeat surface protein [Mogibacterium sp.]